MKNPSQRNHKTQRRHEKRSRPGFPSSLLKWLLFAAAGAFLWIAVSTGEPRQTAAWLPSAADPSPVPLLFRGTEEDMTILRRLLTLHPLPDGFRPVLVKASEKDPLQPASGPSASFALSLIHRGPGHVSPDSETNKSSILSTIVLRERALVPVVSIYDPRESVDLSETSSMVCLPPEALSSQDKALAVDGFYIDDPRYPLTQRDVLILERIPSGGEPFEPSSGLAELVRWCSAAAASADIEALEGKPPFSSDTTIRWIAGVGDIMVQRGIQDILISRGKEGMEYIFGDTLPVLQSMDFLIGNLEGAVSSRGTPVPKSYNFRFSPEVLPSLKEAGFDYLSITNNHCYDYGPLAFIDTLDHLRDADIATSGAGRTPEEAYAPYMTLVKDFPVKVLSLGAYPREKNGFDGRQVASVNEDRPGIIFSGPEALEAIKNFSGPESIDILVAHGGIEWSSSPSEEQKSFYRRCREAGADLLIAHHPHVLQGMEGYKGGLIAYSVGNFLFPGMSGMPHAEESMILAVGFLRDRPLYIRPMAVLIDDQSVSLEKPGGPVLHRFLDLGRDLR